MTDRILCVDDDRHLLAALQRNFYKKFNITTALSGEEGLQRLREEPFAAVVSDFNMPGMNGVQFLTEAKQVRKESTRLLLTGYADLNTAMDAVNEGHIFRLLSKPISTAAMSLALQAALEQYRLVMAERELLSKTLMGSVKILMDLLGKVYPPAIERSSQLKALVRAVSLRLRLADAWQFELAAMLSQIGYLTAPTPLLDKYYTGAELTQTELYLLNQHATSGEEMLKQVPRLESVAEMVGKQHWVFTSQSFVTELEQREPVVLGAQLLQTMMEFEARLARGQTQTQVISAMRFSGNYDTRLLHHLEQELAANPALAQIRPVKNSTGQGRTHGPYKTPTSTTEKQA